MNQFIYKKSISLSFCLLIAVASSSLLLTGCGDKPTPPAAADVHGDEPEEEGEGKHVELTPEQVEKAGIVVVTVGPANLSEHLPLYGAIAPNAERVLEVTGRFPGIIRSVKKRVGDAVRKGETLAVVESNESLQTYAVVAPLDGVVTQRNANEGAQSGDGPLFTVADLSTVWVELSVFPRDLAKVKTGQTARVRSADTGLTADGKVVYVAPFGSANNQTLTARVQLANRDQKWPPGLYVTANIVLASTTIPLAVQNDALQTLEDRVVVFVRGDEGFEPRAINLGRSDGEISEVISGLTVGESYATKNSFILKAELGKGDAEHGH
jgi:cobalt-zinc-cadmium efflux system membrane fusion protein